MDHAFAHSVDELSVVGGDRRLTNSPQRNHLV
jgi:hypothetical protein